MRITRTRTPRPFLKWAGGKTKLLPKILPCLPEQIDLYVEPFLGGGAVFLELARQGRVRKAILGDRNPELVLTWRMVRDETDAVVKALGRWKPNDEQVYYQVRALDPSTLDEPTQAARVLWLNRNCYNGLYRLNSKGTFNVPFGRYDRVRVVDVENLYACADALRAAEVELVDEDFGALLGAARPGATVYCDPPYWPVSKTSCFNNYDGTVFGPADQRRLAEAFHGLVERGVHGVLSNSSTEDTRALYQGLRVHKVHVRRNINRDANGRGPVEELLVEARPAHPDAGVGRPRRL